MSITRLALAGSRSVGLLQTQDGRAVPEIVLALTPFAAITTALAHRHIGGLVLRIAKWVSILGLVLVVAFVFLF